CSDGGSRTACQTLGSFQKFLDECELLRLLAITRPGKFQSRDYQSVRLKTKIDVAHFPKALQHQPSASREDENGGDLCCCNHGTQRFAVPDTGMLNKSRTGARLSRPPLHRPRAEAEIQASLEKRFAGCWRELTVVMCGLVVLQRPSQ